MQQEDLCNSSVYSGQQQKINSMKTLTTLAALLIAGASAYANVGENNEKKPTSSKKTVAVVQNVQDKYKLVYLLENKGAVKINIFNEAGERVYAQTVSNQKGFAQQFDFSTLPYGTYTFEVTNPDDSKVSEVVEHRKPAASVKANILDVNDGSKFRLAVLQNSLEPVKVQIFDSNGKVVYQEIIDAGKGFRKVYDLKNVNSSSYRFEVSNNEGTVTMLSE